ncbi:LicD family protein [Sphingobacterium detergens]|uniref:LicD/FKTN/FKRP nucleotidyltransferase domain-containing protein n=1 Tax=Sphingobacterium detergens TaxID=1145106 RepID=A0A420BKJ5_SPHD1|nr:LicD family protein [Sphingobacterium detergens]RKE57197.1 hypothetical protein DFQ12_2075 [Sphingobacterium detergens]
MPNHILNCLLSVSKLLDDLGIIWFLNGGCCLGYVRNGEMISHDLDIDISVYVNKNEIHDIIELLPVCKVRYFRGNICEATLYLDDGQVDIFFLFEFGNYIVENMSNEFENKVKLLGYEKSIFIEGIKRDTISGIEVNVLKRSVDYCKALYGPSYLTPNKSWNSWLDPFNCIYEEPIIDLSQLKTSKNRAYSDQIEKELSWINNILLFGASSFKNEEISLNSSISRVIFYYEYSAIFKYKPNHNFADYCIERISCSLSKDISLSMKSGLTGISWGLTELIQQKYINISEDDLLSEVNAHISMLVDNNKNDINILTDVGIYFSKRGFLTSNDKKILMSILSYIDFFIQNFKSNHFLSYDLILKIAFVSSRLNIILDKVPSLELPSSLNYLIKFYKNNSPSSVEDILGFLSIVVSLGLIEGSKSLRNFLIENDWIINYVAYNLELKTSNSNNLRTLLRIIHLCNWIIQNVFYPAFEVLKKKCINLIVQKDIKSANPFIEYRGYQVLTLDDGIIGIGFMMLNEYKQEKNKDLHFALLL